MVIRDGPCADFRLLSRLVAFDSESENDIRSGTGVGVSGIIGKSSSSSSRSLSVSFKANTE